MRPLAEFCSPFSKIGTIRALACLDEDSVVLVFRAAAVGGSALLQRSYELFGHVVQEPVWHYPYPSYRRRPVSTYQTAERLNSGSRPSPGRRWIDNVSREPGWR